MAACATKGSVINIGKQGNNVKFFYFENWIEKDKILCAIFEESYGAPTQGFIGQYSY
jgi:hypothetical protein